MSIEELSILWLIEWEWLMKQYYEGWPSADWMSNTIKSLDNLLQAASTDTESELFILKPYQLFNPCIILSC